ncbi:hypothetical protein LshimejAT787_0701160 [Lyophyllum shimeji]|uniref:NB-ARC domain-containing protein n=1 Tax=Lyophyllum shimeji TaxID=47721 RepID=A0A9P3PPW8_LYOSH|nr:hypothetical protein LshimejAT787_0701160 [Lyophyllum shimeji]
MNVLRDTLSHLLLTVAVMLLVATLKGLGKFWISGWNSSPNAISNLGIKVLASGDDPTVDIVAIHGLSGDREAAWTASTNGVLWLRDLLGGIILKQALCHAFPAGSKHLSNHKAIQVSTSGIIFLGTPHQGANGITLGKIVLQIQSLYSSTNDGVLKHLARDSEILEVQQAHFTPISERIDMTFFYEAHATRLPGGGQIMLVPRSSAVVPGVRDAQAIAINKDHSGMSKFASSEDDDFRTVLESVRGMVRKAPDKIKGEWQRYKKIESIRSDLSALSYAPAPSQHFTGRNSIVTELYNLFFGRLDATMQQRVLLHGMAGVGKTQITLKFTDDNTERFWRIFWVDANNTETIESSLRTIAIDDPDAKMSGVRETPQSVLRWISQADGEWLIIYDNADRDSGLIAKYLPPGNAETCSSRV